MLTQKHIFLLLGGMVLFSCLQSFAPLTTHKPNSALQEVRLTSDGRIAPNDPLVTISGAFFLQKTAQRVIINRFTEAVLANDSTFMNPLKARTQSGVSIALQTTSPWVTFYFEKRDSSVYRTGLFAVYRNDVLVNEVKITPKTPVDSLTVFSEDTSTTQWTSWQVVLPPFFGLNFKGMRVRKGSKYKKVFLPQKVYVAIGNSITHGTGQRGSHQTYPFLLARKKGWKVYNLAVSGSRTSWPVATLLRGQQVDVVTVLWGYNDWNAGFTLEQESTYYRRLVEELLKAQPQAHIYCITPTFTYRTTPKRGNLKLDDLRNVQAQVVAEFQKKGFKNLFLIHGEQISGPQNLKPKGEKDVVHFTIEGAARFTDSLAKAITNNE